MNVNLGDLWARKVFHMITFGLDFSVVQAKLNSLGANPQLVVDGVNGPKSKAAVMAFQNSRGLVADGVVGPLTLAALGLTGNESSSGGASTMGNAPPPSAKVQKYWEIAKKAAQQAGMSEKQLQYSFTVAKGEGGFGEGWGNPSAATIAKSQKFGLTGYEGKDSNNWGATQGQGDAGSFPHVDSGWMVPDANGQPTSKHWPGSGPKVWGDYVANYKKWSTPEKGFLDMANIILKGGKRGTVGAAEIKDAIEKGNLRDAVYAQHANGYFELDPAQYLSAVLKNYQSLTGLPDWKKLLGENGVAIAAAAGGAGVGLALLGLGLGYAWWRSRS